MHAPTFCFPGLARLRRKILHLRIRRSRALRRRRNGRLRGRFFGASEHREIRARSARLRFGFRGGDRGRAAGGNRGAGPFRSGDASRRLCGLAPRAAAASSSLGGSGRLSLLPGFRRRRRRGRIGGSGTGYRVGRVCSGRRGAGIFFRSRRAVVGSRLRLRVDSRRRHRKDGGSRGLGRGHRRVSLGTGAAPAGKHRRFRPSFLVSWGWRRKPRVRGIDAGLGSFFPHPCFPRERRRRPSIRFREK